jgi:N-dimethylarginine dimethylaminohydrolase
MNPRVKVDVDKAKAEHAAIKQALLDAGVNVVQVPPPKDCQDGVYTANWALCRGNKAVMSALPNKRQAETPYAEAALKNQGKEIIYLPEGMRFSGQGDALPFGQFLFAGTNYRTDFSAHGYLQHHLDYKVISLQTIPKRKWFGYGSRIVNEVTGWPDSYYYDLDLALGVIDDNTIAYCPDAFVPFSKRLLANLPVRKIIVSRAEATKGFACNLVSTGETVIMSPHAPKLKKDIEALGF